MIRYSLPYPPSLTAERLREVLRYDAETGQFWWIKTSSKKASAIKSRPAGCIGKVHGYRLIRVDGILYRACRLAWLWQHGRWPDPEIDHANGDPSDDRIANLREASRAQNNANTRAPRDSRSGVKGVSWHAKDKKWRARLGGTWLGNYDTKEEASAAYQREALARFGEFARASS